MNYDENINNIKLVIGKNISIDFKNEKLYLEHEGLKDEDTIIFTVNERSKIISLFDKYNLGSKIYNNKTQNSDYLRVGINTALTLVAISNPVGIIAVGAYGVFDYYYGDKFWEKTGIDNY